MMPRLKHFLATCLLLCLVLPLSAHAAIEERTFANDAQEALYTRLTKELRCLVCQNQNLADSNADLAKDLREKAYLMVIDGQDHQQITTWMIERYGDFVLYKPPLNKATYLLWIGPFVILLLALLVLISFTRKKKRLNIEKNTDDQLAHARKLIDDD